METNPEVVAVQKVAIIGAGYSGLCALRHFVEDKKYKPVIFEKDPDIGGIWRVPGTKTALHPDIGTDLKRPEPYSPMYENLRSNSPRDMTAFVDFPFPKNETSSYFNPSEFMQYFRDYAADYSLLPHIKLGHEITIVEPVNVNRPSGPQWRVRWRNRNNDEMGEDVFYVLIVCNGHHATAFLPEISGLAAFKGSVIHSNRYKTARVYQDKTVLLIGASYSANDILCHIQPLAKKVILSRRKPDPAAPVFSIFPNVLETDSIKEYGGDFVVLSDGTKTYIDAIILCTGYDYSFPFLAEACHVRVQNARVTPVYRHVIHMEYPSMAFIGLLDYVAYTPTCDIQVKFYKAFLDGKFQLPSKEEMLEDSERDYQRQLKDGPRNAHKLYQNIWEYMDKLATDGGFQSYEPSVRKIFDWWADMLHTLPYAFRNYRAEKLDSENCYLEPVPESEKKEHGTLTNGHLW